MYMKRAMNGGDLTKLMRSYGVTIKQLAERMDITMKRVREVRKHGTMSWNSKRDFVQAVTGVDPGDLHPEGGAEWQ